MKKRSVKKLLAISLAASMALPSTAAFAADGAGAMSKVVGEKVVRQTAGKKSARRAAKKKLAIQELLDESKTQIQTPALDEEVNFIVELEEQPLLEQKKEEQSLEEFMSTNKGAAAASAIKREQASVEEALAEMETASVEIGYSYQVILNGFSVKAPYGAKEELEKIAGVKKVYVAATHEYVEPKEGYTQAVHTSGAMMDSDRANAEGYTGKGVVTAVLDTGAMVDHEVFAADPADPRYTKDDIAAKVEEGNLQAEKATADEVYKSAKIPYAYDYADGDTDVADSQGHGTHVAGTVGAESAELTGVAPDTQLFIMKVFSDTSDGASDAWIFAALEDCVIMGVDAANMSLGSACGFTTDDDLTDEVYGRVEAAGINLMCAAGNETDSAASNLLGTNMSLISNPDTGVVGSPSTYHAALSVASVNENSVVTPYFMAGDRKIAYSDNADTAEKKWISMDGQTLEYVAVPNVGAVADFEGLDMEGKIALIQRGEIAFTEKEQNAVDAGAIAVLIYDNVVGELPNMQTNGLVPMIAISKEDGEYMAGLETKTLSVSKDYVENRETAESGLMSDFSSLGVTPDLSLKPEITAPGGNIYSSTMDGAYGNMSGTSMACPHMAGAAAVMRQYVTEAFPEADANTKQVLVNELLMSTAVPVVDEYGVVYTPRSQGAGLAEVYNAIHTKGYITVGDSTRTKAELKDNEEGSYAFTFTVHNFGDADLTYDVSATPLVAKTETIDGLEYISLNSRELTAEEFAVAFSEDTVVVPAGGTKDVTVTMNLTDAGKANLAAFVNGVFMDGFINLTAKDEGSVNLTLPYLGFYGDWADAPLFDGSIYDEEQSSMYESCMAQLNWLFGNGSYLGMNGFDGTTDMNKIVIASQQMSFLDGIFSMQGMLRSAEELTYDVVFHAKLDDGTVEDIPVYQNGRAHVGKSFYYANGGFITYDLGPEDYGWFPSVILDDGEYYIKDGDLTYTITGKIAGSEETQSVSYPIIIDNVAPEVVSTKFVEEDGVPYLIAKVKDDNYLMGVVLVDGNGNSVGDLVPINDSERGEIVTLKFDLTSVRESGVTYGHLEMMDYGQNVSVSDDFSLISIAENGLYKLIDLFDSLNADDYTAESWAEVAAAAEAAREAVNSPTAVQADIDAAVSALVAALGKLQYKEVQTLHLETAIEAAEAILAHTNNYEDTEALAAAVAAGKEVLAKEGATQEEVDNAAYAILDELFKLAKTADVTSLESLIEAAKDLLDGEYTSGSLDNLKDAIQNAEDVLADPNRTEEAIGEAYGELIDAIINLEMKGNKAALKAMLLKANEVLANADAYVAATIEGLAEVTAAAQEVYDNDDAVQSEVDDAVKTLTLKVAEARLLGDVNGDGKVNTADSAEVLKAAAEMNTLDTEAAASADVNGDGVADTSDAVLILQYAAEKIAAF